MIRVLLENVALFLLPTVAYVAYVMLTRKSEQGPVRLLEGAPLVWLFVSGAALVLLTLSLFSSTTGGRPGEVYRPAVIKDGRIVSEQKP